MYIKKITIENFKGFVDKTTIEFNFPSSDGEHGLNFFIGENNTGKTTVFEAIDFLFSGVATGKTINDFKNKNHLSNDINIELEVAGNSLKELLDTKYHKCINDVNGLEIVKLRRTSKEYGIDQGGRKPVQVNEKKLLTYNLEKNQYENISGFDKAFKEYFDIDFIWSNSNPDDIAKYGSTTVVGKLIKKISDSMIESPDFKELLKVHNTAFNEGEDSLKGKLKHVGEEAEKIFKEQFGEAKIEFNFEAPDITSYLKNAKVNVDDGITTNLEYKGSGMQRSIALTLLQVYIKLESSVGRDKKPFYFFIDEPEISLHPLAQIKLIKSLSKLSEQQQIFLTTHSPYIFKEAKGHLGGVYLFKKEIGKINIENASGNFGLFGESSPTWGEINYFAYNLPSVEFHNELYGFIQSKAIAIDNKYSKEKEFNVYLEEEIKSLNSYEWIRNHNIKYNTTIQTYIRNKIHHPENTLNREFTSDELNQSIEEMITLLKGLQ